MRVSSRFLNSQVASFAIIAFALPLYLLLLSGFPTIAASKVCAMIFIQISAGGFIWQKVPHRHQVDPVETVGMGFAIGSIFSVVGHQLTLGRSFQNFGWALPLLIALTVALLSKKDLPQSSRLDKIDLISVFFVPFAIAATFTQWWWLLPLLIPFGFAIYLATPHGKKKFDFSDLKIICTLIIVLIPTTLFIIYLRQLNLGWWIRSWDVTYFESKSFSIAKFGPSKNISLTGYPMNYHWFGIAWIGTISVITKLPSWLSVAQVAPIYSVISITCLIWAIGRRLGNNRFQPFVIALIFTFATPTLSPANPPNIISMIWAVAALLVAFDFASNQSVKIFSIFAILSIATLSGKVSAGFIILVAFTVTDLLRTLHKKQKLSLVLLRNAVLAVLAATAFFLIIGGPNRLGNNTFKLSYKGPGYFFGVEPERNPIIFAFGTFGISIGFFQILLISIVALTYRYGEKDLLFFCIWAFIAGYLPFLIATDDGMAYFASNALNFAGLGATIAILPLIHFLLYEKKFSKFHILLAAFCALALGKLSKYIFELNWNEIILIRGGSTTIRILILLSSLALYWLATNLIVRPYKTPNRKEQFKVKLILFSIVVLFANTLPGIYNHLQRSLAHANDDYFAVPYIGNENIALASSWVKLNVNSDALIATNKFCIEERAEFCVDARLFIVSATTQRQMLIEAPTRSVRNGGDDESLYPKWAKERLDLSRGFADKPNAEITTKLREYGVDWFYLFKENTKNRDWEPYGTVKYENSEIAIIKLNDK